MPLGGLFGAKKRVFLRKTESAPLPVFEHFWHFSKNRVFSCFFDIFCKKLCHGDKKNKNVSGGGSPQNWKKGGVPCFWGQNPDFEQNPGVDPRFSIKKSGTLQYKVIINFLGWGVTKKVIYILVIYGF
jgi:hypothetical protein